MLHQSHGLGAHRTTNMKAQNKRKSCNCEGVPLEVETARIDSPYSWKQTRLRWKHMTPFFQSDNFHLSWLDQAEKCAKVRAIIQFKLQETVSSTLDRG